jgi:hypothetical protein
MACVWALLALVSIAAAEVIPANLTYTQLDQHYHYCASFLVAVCSVVTDTITQKHGAACLDGTNPGYYYAPANSSAMSTTWVLYFKDKSKLPESPPHLSNWHHSRYVVVGATI